MIPPSFVPNDAIDNDVIYGVSAGEVSDVSDSFKNFEFPSDIAMSANNAYLNELKDSRDLYLRMPQKIYQFYKKWDILGLLYLFLPPARFECMRIWTNEVMEKKGYEKASETLVYAFIGLEMAMGILNFNAITDFWSESPFLGSQTFKTTMPRHRFEEIRDSLQIHPPSIVAGNYSGIDPLYFCRPLLDCFRKNAAEVAAPLGILSLDEASQGTSARTSATSYNPSKPDKHAVRFYSVNGHSPKYCTAICDNGAGNKEQSTPCDRYLRSFRSMSTMHQKSHMQESKTDDDPPLDGNTPSALYALMMSQQNFSDDTRSMKKRVCFPDSYYTRHNVVRSALLTTGGLQRLVVSTWVADARTFCPPGVATSSTSIGNDGDPKLLCNPLDL